MTGRESPPKAARLIADVERAARRAEDAASVLRGIPAFISTWSAFDSIGRDLRYAIERYERDTDGRD